MVDGINEIVWTKRSLKNLQMIFDYISKDSLQNANKVINDIVKSMEKTQTNAFIYNVDKYKINNDGNYRAFEKHHYRVVYKIIKNTLYVLRVRHTKQEPFQY